MIEVLTLALLNKKLEYAPQSILLKVIGSVDALIDLENKEPNSLTQEQEKILDNQIDLDAGLYSDADKLHN